MSAVSKTAVSLRGGDSRPPGEEALVEVPRAEPELTPRALVWGAVLGCLLGVSNLYLGLLMGAGISVGAMAVMMATPLRRGLAWVMPGLGGRAFSLGEGCVLQTTASGAGYAVISSLPSLAVAWVMTQGAPLSVARLMVWTLGTSWLGLCFGLLLQRRLLPRADLAFPASAGTAAVLRAMDAHPRAAPARVLFTSIAGSSLVGLLRDWLQWLPGAWLPPGALAMTATGALVGPRMAVSMVLGAALCFGGLVPALVEHGVVESAESAVPLHTAWAGSALLVSAVLVHAVMAVGRLLRAGRAVSGPPSGEGAPEPALVPRPVLWTVTVGLAAACVVLAWLGLGISLVKGGLAVGLSLAVSAFVCRVVAEAGQPPDMAVNQVASGVLLRGGPVAHLAHASVSFNTSAVAADLLSNLKTARLLGVGAREQLVAQGVGCTLGVLVLVPIFRVLVPDASVVAGLPGAGFLAPAGQQARVLTEMLGQGVGGLPLLQQVSVLAAVGLGVLLALAEAVLPERLRGFVPSALGLGLAFFLPPVASLLVGVGAAVRWAVARRQPERLEQWVFPGACGVMAAESLFLVAGALLATP